MTETYLDKRDRITYVDTAKFFAICLVVWGHCYARYTPFVYAFQVQLFFVVIGFVYSNSYENYTSYINKIIKLVKRIFIPYIIFEMMYDGLTLDSFIKALYGSNQTVDTLWFFPTYMSSVILYDIIEISIKRFSDVNRRYIRFALSVLFFLLASITQYSSDLDFNIAHTIIHLTGFSTGEKGHFWLGFPFSLNIAFMVYVLISFGRLFRWGGQKLSKSVNKVNVLILCVILYVIGYLCYKANLDYVPNWKYNFTAISFAAYGNELLFMLSSVLLSFATICLSYIVDNNLFQKYGKITLGIYLVHVFYNRSISEICLILDYVFMPEIKFVFVLLLTIPTVLFLNKYLPSLMGVQK